MICKRSMTAYQMLHVMKHHMRYPTDEKLLWEGCEWIYKELILLCKELGIRRPRSKYKEQKQPN